MKAGVRIRGLLKNWLIIVAAVLVGIGVAAVYALVVPLQYAASSVVFFSANTSPDDTRPSIDITDSMVASYADLVKTPIVTVPTIDELELDESPEALAERITTTVSPNTTIVTITVTGTDAEATAEQANALASNLAAAVAELAAPDETSDPAAEDGTTTTGPVRVTVVSEATVPPAALSPNVPLALLIGALSGLVAGVVIALIVVEFNTHARATRRLERAVAAPLLATIPYDQSAVARPIITYADPFGPRSVGFRALQSAVADLADAGGGASYVVTSSLQGEGASSTAINLAISLSDNGKRVALIDTDLRHPKVGDYLGLRSRAGLADVLGGRVRVGDVMLPWGGPTLYVMPAGTTPSNPTEILASHNMRTLMGVLERDFDVVIYDGPPLVFSADSAILAHIATGAIVVAAAGQEARLNVVSAAEALRFKGASVVGVVITMASEGGTRRPPSRSEAMPIEGPRRSRRGSPLSLTASDANSQRRARS